MVVAFCKGPTSFSFECQKNPEGGRGKKEGAEGPLSFFGVATQVAIACISRGHEIGACHGKMGFVFPKKLESNGAIIVCQIGRKGPVTRDDVSLGRPKKGLVFPHLRRPSTRKATASTSTV